MLDSFCNLQPTEFSRIQIIYKHDSPIYRGCKAVPIPEIVTVFTKHYDYPILVDQHYCQC